MSSQKRAAKKAKTVSTWSSRVDGNCLVTIDDSIEFLQTLSNRLFIRSCYHDLLSLCRDMWTDSQGIFVVGTPGIGKSCFLDYVLHHCLYGTGQNDQQNVLYLYATKKKAFLFRHNTANTIITVDAYFLDDYLDWRKEISEDSFDIVLYDPHEDTARTLDVSIHHMQGKKFIVAVSPGIGNCKKLRKDTAKAGIGTLYMGTLPSNEAEAMRSSCFATSVSKDLLQRRYRIMGGIPRHLFEPIPRLNDQGDRAVFAIGQRQARALKLIAKTPDLIDDGEIASEFKGLWSLFHLQPLPKEDGGTNFFRYTIELACEDVRIQIRTTLMEKNVNDLWKLYINTEDRYGTLKGIRYEAYAHKKILTHGVNSTAVKLIVNGVSTSTSTKKQITIPASLPEIEIPTNDLQRPSRRVVGDTSGLDTGGYLLPVKSNFPVVDSLYVPGNAGNATDEILCLQMKAVRSKPLSGESSTIIQAATEGPLVFVVPDETIVSKKFSYLGDGPTEWNQYRLVLKENTRFL